jgi:serine/threonine protein phosphatase 1
MQTGWIHTFTSNTRGTDWVVGDIHGHYSRLQAALDAVGFDPDTDRLFACGDLVDRGPESEQAIDWLGLPWFHSVRGNHCDYVVRYRTVNTENWIRNGGLWFQGLSEYEQFSIADELSILPFVIQIETAAGTVGIVHANPIVEDWRELSDFCTRRRNRESLIWSRERVESNDNSRVAGTDCVCVGHTPVDTPKLLGNVWHLDTAGWADDGYFSVLKLDDLIHQARDVEDLRSHA